jgi:HEPN domain-containing protein
MNKDDLIAISRIRLDEARTLLKNANYDGAYYLCGYVVECGLKACIAKKTAQYDFPDLATVRESYTHNLGKLVRIAGLELSLEKEISRDPDFESNWAIVKDWSEESRYERHAYRETRDLWSAIASRKSGVLRWIRHHW